MLDELAKDSRLGRDEDGHPTWDGDVKEFLAIFESEME